MVFANAPVVRYVVAPRVFSRAELARLEEVAKEWGARGLAYLVNEGGELRKLDELEAEIIRFALQHYRGHMSEVSRRLGIGRSTLYRKLKELGLEDEAA